MSDPLLPVPDAEPSQTDQERAREVDDIGQPDVLPGSAEDEHRAEPRRTDYRAPVAGDRLDADELREDLAEE